MHMGVEKLEHAMTIVEKVLSIEKNITIVDMQFGFMQGIGTMDAVFILRRI